MKKMMALRSALVATGCFNADSLVTWVEDMQLKVRGKQQGDAILLHTLVYQAVFSIERYPYKQHPIEHFNAILVTWLSENDDRSELDNSDPDIDVNVLDDSTADLELTLTFEEDVYIIPDDDGTIEFKDRMWALKDPAYWIAESGDVVDQ